MISLKASLFILSWNGTCVGPTAAVERAHAYCARSGSKGSARVSFRSFLSWGLCEQEGWLSAPSQPTVLVWSAAQVLIPALPNSLL
jgi:hypothetical protein